MIKKYFLAGLAALLPLVLTIVVTIFLFDFFTTPFINIVGPRIEEAQYYLDFHLSNDMTIFISRIAVLVFLFFLILFLGFIARMLITQPIIHWIQKVLYKIPFVKTIYKITKEVFTALFSDDGKKAFKHSVMIPFPNENTFAVGFESGEILKECEEKTGRALINVFMPTAPHPISGFLLMIPKDVAKPVELTKEELLKLIVSCGMIVPGTAKTENDDK
jgi:uncharacterized membrane protein